MGWKLNTYRKGNKIPWKLSKIGLVKVDNDKVDRELIKRGPLLEHSSNESNELYWTHPEMKDRLATQYLWRNCIEPGSRELGISII